MGVMAEVVNSLIWGADRIDRIDSKSMQPSETLGLLAILKLNDDILFQYSICILKDKNS